MATTCGAVNFWMARVQSSSSPGTRVNLVPVVNRRHGHGHGYYSRLRAAAAEILSEKVEKSVAEAKKVCWDDPESGECVAAWDEVEELSAAASHARERERKHRTRLTSTVRSIQRPTSVAFMTINWGMIGGVGELSSIEYAC